MRRFAEFTANVRENTTKKKSDPQNTDFPEVKSYPFWRLQFMKCHVKLFPVSK